MKRTASLGLTLLVLLSLCVPSVPAAPKVRGYEGFSDILSTEDPYFGAVKTCYEAGLMEGMKDGSFQPQRPLTVAQLVVLAGRLYSLQNDGQGEIPLLPEWRGVCLRFYGPDGRELKTYSIGDSTSYHSLDGGLYLQLSEQSDDPDLPETCTLEAGLEGWGELLRFEGNRQSYAPHPAGTMTEGLSGTGYRFQSQQAAKVCSLYLSVSREEFAQYRDAWWFPAAFYLASQGRLDLHQLQARAVQEGEFSAYDPLTNFSNAADRSLFAWLLDLAAGELPPVRETVTVPDVDVENTPDAEAILRLYRAGILTGVDHTGRFHGEGLLTRGQAALMLSRVLEAG